MTLLLAKFCLFVWLVVFFFFFFFSVSFYYYFFFLLFVFNLFCSGWGGCVGVQFTYILRNYNAFPTHVVPSFFYQLQRYKTVTVRPSYVIFKLFMEAQIKQIYIYILYTVMIMIYIYDHRR